VEGSPIELLPTVIWHLDEPLADAAALPTYQIAALARRHVKVALTGEGADEIFGGYRYIRTLYRLAALEFLPGLLKTALAGLAGPVSALPPRELMVRVARVLRSLPRDLPTRYRRSVTIFDDAARARLLGPATHDALAAMGDEAQETDLVDRAQVPDALNWLLAVHFQSWLPDDLLMKVDKMSMAVGLEARTPFLDHRLVEETTRWPANFKIRGWTNKYLLRRLAAELLPPAIAQRPKHGFDVPIDAWLRGEMRQLLSDTLASRDIHEAGIIDCDEARRIAADHLAERGDFGQQLWSILCFQLWYAQYGNLPLPTPDCTRVAC
jgi:asparagine synthase (glutamine-hydrolysing)